jgi:2-polyprenyl-3-methyl-5-hydroxy-6-metoxy-1,4-benzoquinol methylase
MVDRQPVAGPPSTSNTAYAERLQRLSRRGGRLRTLIDPQRPYRWNLRRLRPGFVLDIGCGIGRNLRHLDGDGVGIDHNVECVAACRAAGLTAFTPAEFAASEYAVDDRFDSILVAHVLEHMTTDEATGLIRDHLRFVRPAGRVIVITPQQRGQASDPTHVALVDPDAVRRIAAGAGLDVVSIGSFPFPRAAGAVFTHNETVSVLRKVAG